MRDVKEEDCEDKNMDMENGDDPKEEKIDPIPDSERYRLSVKEVNNKIMGLVYGCVLGEIAGLSDNVDKMTGKLEWGFSTDQLILIINTITETGMMHVNTFLQMFQVYGNKGMLELDDNHNNIDIYTKEIVSSYEALADPAKISFEQYEKYNKKNLEGEKDSLSTCDNTTLIRCAMMGIYNDWDSFTFAATMATHADHRCISAGIIISAATRSMLLGAPTKISEIVTETAAMILAMKKMTNIRDVNQYLRFTSEGYCTDLRLLNLKGGDQKHTYKCMSQSMYALGKIVESNRGKISIAPSENFKDIIKEIHAEGGDRAANCALSGALMGCEIGYDNLPSEWIQLVNEKHRDILEEKIMNYLQCLGLLETKEPEETLE